MAETFGGTAWSALILGMYVLAVGVGALRKPGIWRDMLIEIHKSAALQLLCGLLELLVGILIYLANPWVPDDLLSCILNFIGGIMMVEALVITAFCDIYAQFWIRTLTHMHKGWAIFTTLWGLALTIAAMFRFH